MNSPVQQKPQGEVLELWVPNNDKPASVFDFHDIGFSLNVARSFVRAFVSLYGALTLESQRANWSLIRRFGNFSFETFGRVERLPQTCLFGFVPWLEKNKYGDKTIGGTYNAVVRILKWCMRNAPEAVHPHTELVRISYAAREKQIDKSVNYADGEELVRKILAACYSDIENSENRILSMRALAKSSIGDSFGSLLQELLSLGNGALPSNNQILKAPKGQTLLSKLGPYGGLRGVQAKYYLNIDDTFPFYLAILAQSSGNPMPILDAARRCIEEVPLRPDLERMVWDKPRAGTDQAPDFPKGKTWSAPNLVRKLLSLNEELRTHANAKDSEALFLCHTLQSKVTRPSWQTIHNSLEKFRIRHELPKFDLRDLRRIGAILHHRAARNIAAAKQRLQHTDDGTIETYTPLSDLRALHDEKIFHFQGLIHKSSLQFGRVSKDALESPPPSIAAETLFGFGCRDPLGGIAPGSKLGEPCSRFFHCASCTGAIVVVDDRLIVARLYQAYAHLLEEYSRAVREGWSGRFEVLYAPTLAILKSDILPAISAGTLEKARTLHCSPLPRLE